MYLLRRPWGLSRIANRAARADVVAIIRNSGVGKSTTINLRSGTKMEQRVIKPDPDDEWGKGTNVIEIAGWGS
jgi:ABC-type nitrate/sulfonate/bicarbonate transport system ATPase subunit